MTTVPAPLAPPPAGGPPLAVKLAGAGTGTPSLYFPTLDGLRFFAFFFVFVHHLPRQDLPVLSFLHSHGYVGVCIFLTLSAYLLTAPQA